MSQPRPWFWLRAGQTVSNSFVLSAKQSSRTSNLNVFCLTRPGIEPPTSRMSGERSTTTLPGRGVLKCRCSASQGCRRGELIWTCFVCAERSTSGSFLCQATDSLPLQVGRKILSEHYNIDSGPGSRFYQLISDKHWEVQTSQFLPLPCVAVGDQSRPSAPRAGEITVADSSCTKHIVAILICSFIVLPNELIEGAVVLATWRAGLSLDGSKANECGGWPLH